MHFLSNFVRSQSCSFLDADFTILVKLLIFGVINLSTGNVKRLSLGRNAAASTKNGSLGHCPQTIFKI